ncbi:Zinc transporter ZIP11 [Triplophysa tibetana]|uniref:Zinc transporter ZIP11 n=1 Tax=Triplophysa tibetana TaxID=1572043 RepID=A0A5A9PT46_9TELE|nr:Zinc transporter ZIP11 [Triplophysa tibetana]
MIPGVSPVVQALLGTLFTWGLTAAGAALVFFFSSSQDVNLLDDRMNPTVKNLMVKEARPSTTKPQGGFQSHRDLAAFPLAFVQGTTKGHRRRFSRMSDRSGGVFPLRASETAVIAAHLLFMCSLITGWVIKNSFWVCVRIPDESVTFKRGGAYGYIFRHIAVESSDLFSFSDDFYFATRTDSFAVDRALQRT